MRKGTAWAALAALGWATILAQGAEAQGARSETIARWHFAGADQLKQLKSQQPLQQVFALPESAALRDTAIAGLSQKAAAHLARGGGQAVIATNLHRLLEDLLRYESKFQWSGPEAAKAEWALAIKAPEGQLPEWKNALSELSRGAGLTVKDGADWSAANDHYTLAFSREKDWSLLRGGYSGGPAASKFLAEFRKSLSQRLDKRALVAEFDLPRLGELWHARNLAQAPRVSIRVEPNHDGFRSEVELEYAQSLGIKPEKWSVPTSLIHSPLAGFTAIQGLREIVQASPPFQALGAKNPPNQLFFWAVDDSPFSAYFAAHVGNPAMVVSNLAHRIIPEFIKNEPAIFTGQFQVATNRPAVIWRGLPVVVPFVEAGSGTAAEHLVAGLFPVSSARTNRPPAALFEQLNKKNVIYYEWEITEGRLKQWRPIWQLAHIVASKLLLRSDTPSENWLEAIVPKLGNTVTEGVLESDRRIKIIRQSHIGFNALELVLLAHWLDPNDFRERPRGQPVKPAPQTPAP